jgi:hypothetical protein
MGRGKTRKEAKSSIYGGIVAVVVLWIASFNVVIFFPVTAVASVVLAVFILCTMPTSCCAERTRGGPCENNASGVFAACKEKNSHVAKKRALVRTRAYWAGLARGHYSAPHGARAVYLAIAALLSGFAALIFTRRPGPS